MDISLGPGDPRWQHLLLKWIMPLASARRAANMMKGSRIWKVGTLLAVAALLLGLVALRAVPARITAPCLGRHPSPQSPFTLPRAERPHSTRSARKQSAF